MPDLPIWKRCGHPRTPKNTCLHRDARKPNGMNRRCRICFNAGIRRKRKSPLGMVTQRQHNQRLYERDRANEARTATLREDNKHASRRYYASQKNQARMLTGHPIRARRVVVLSDIQLPFEDHQALDLALQFIQDYKPDTIVLNGDITDCYGMSQFDKNPLNIETTAQELDKAKALMGLLSSIPQKVWLGGNHEDRWRKILWREGGAKNGISPIVTVLMHGLGIDRFDVDESWRKCFEVSKYGFTYWPYRHYLELAEGNLLITHGFLVSMHSAYSAKRHYERLGKSLIIGHTHRMGTYLISQLWEPKGAWENGCLCRLDPEYVQFPNWQQGFSAVTIQGSTFHVQQIPILPGYRIQYQERVFTADPPKLWTG